MKKTFAVLLCLALLFGMTAALAETTIPADIAVDDIVIFGHYEQDNDPSNGPEPIEWIVLEVTDGKAFLLSKYGLDAKPYNTEFTYVTWENCTLRKWLYADFLNTAFTADEQGQILLTDVDNSQSQGYSELDTVGGNDTQDKVFLLSYAQANQFLGVVLGDIQNIKSRVSPTAYAIARGAYTNSDNKTSEGKATGMWWLRSPGSQRDIAATVYVNGSLHGNIIFGERVVVRPALVLRLF